MFTHMQIQLDHVIYQDIQNRRETVRTIWNHQQKNDHDVQLQILMGIQKLHEDQKNLPVILKMVL